MFIPTPRRVALIGLMGAGKSRVGRLVARDLGWPFYDSDQRVEEMAGKDIAAVFRDESEEGFRSRETRVVRDLAEIPPPLIAALGGGVVIREANRAILETAFHVVWLRVDPQEAFRRVGSSSGRPLLAGTDPEEALKRLERVRSPFSSGLADLVVDTGPETTPESCCRQIVNALRCLP